MRRAGIQDSVSPVLTLRASAANTGIHGSRLCGSRCYAARPLAGMTAEKCGLHDMVKKC
jgi:hypothetical protein